MDTPDRWTDPETDNRYYKSGSAEPSVTTILEFLDEDTSGLDNWRNSNDGDGTNPNWEHLFWYKRNRGTLCHWHALSTVDSSLEYSHDEYSSRWELYAQQHDNVADDSAREVLYSVLKDRGVVSDYGDFYAKHPPYKPTAYYAEALLDLVDTDIEYFTDTFTSIWAALSETQSEMPAEPEGGEVPIYGLCPIEVERFLLNHEYGFGGQADLVVEYPDGDIAVCDLKTSSSNRDKNKAQLAAYAQAVEDDTDIPVDSVDRTEVWRIHPDSGTFSIHANERYSPLHSDSYWRETREESWQEFLDARERFADEYDLTNISVPEELQ